MLFRTSDGYKLRLVGGYFQDADFSFVAVEILPGVMWPQDAFGQWVQGHFGEEKEGTWVPSTLIFEWKAGVYYMAIDDDGNMTWVDDDTDVEVAYGTPKKFKDDVGLRGRFAWRTMTYDLLYLT